MDDIERRHYEQKVSKLDGLIAKASEDGDRITMDQLMNQVGLSPRMKDRVDKISAANAGDGNSTALPGSTQPFESQSIKQRRITERKLID